MATSVPTHWDIRNIAQVRSYMSVLRDDPVLVADVERTITAFETEVVPQFDKFQRCTNSCINE